MNGPVATVGHDQLADLLAAWLMSAKSRMTWNNMRFDVIGEGRPDVFSITKTLHMQKCSPMVHEVKISRADYWSDVRSEKWRKYQSICQHFYFVCPVGMIEKSEVPKEAGLLVYDTTAQYRFNSFAVVKRPLVNHNWQFEEPFLMRLIMGRWGSEPSMFAKQAIKAAGGLRMIEGGLAA